MKNKYKERIYKMNNKLIVFFIILIVGINIIMIIKLVSGLECSCPSSGNWVVSSSCQITTACLLSQNSKISITGGRVQVTSTGILSIYGGNIIKPGSLQVDKSGKFIIKKPY